MASKKSTKTKSSTKKTTSSENKAKSKGTKTKSTKRKAIEEYESELAQMRAELADIGLIDKEDLGDYSFEDDDEELGSENLVEYNQLTEVEERQRIKKNMAKAHVFLEKLGIQDLEIDAINHIIVVPFEYEDLQFLSHIIVGPEWYIVKASILELDENFGKVEKDLFFELLKGNFLLNDVTYSVDPDKKSVWCEADIPANSTYDQFKLHYLSIVFAIDYFIRNISNELKAPLQSTYPADKSNDNLYI